MTARYTATHTETESTVFDAESSTPATPICTIPKYQSNFFSKLKILEFVSHPLTGEVLIVGCPEPSQLGVFNLKGELLHLSGHLGDYIVKVQMVNDGKHLVVDYLIWHPIYFKELLAVDQLLTTPEYQGQTIWEEGCSSEVAPTITEEHLEYSARQKYSWAEVLLREDQIEFRSEETRLGKYTAALIDEGQIEVSEREQGQKQVRGVIPLKGNPNFFLAQFLPRPEQEPLLLVRTSPRVLSLWTLNGELVREVDAAPEGYQITELSIVGEYIHVTCASVVDVEDTDPEKCNGLIKIEGLLSGSDVRLRIYNHPTGANVWSYQRNDGVVVGSDQKLYTWTELFEIGHLSTYLRSQAMLQYPTSFLHHLLNSVSIAGAEVDQKIKVWYNDAGPPPDTSVNQAYQPFYNREPPHPLVEVPEIELRAAIHDLVDNPESVNVKVFGTGSRIIMPHFRDSLVSSQIIHPQNLAQSMYMALFGDKWTNTDQLDLSFLFPLADRQYLIRCRLRNLTPDYACRYDPEAVLEVFVHQI